MIFVTDGKSNCESEDVTDNITLTDPILIAEIKASKVRIVTIAIG